MCSQNPPVTANRQVEIYRILLCHNFAAVSRRRTKKKRAFRPVFNRAGDDLWNEFTLPACLADLCAMVLFVVLTKAEALCEGRGRFEK
jgi:hypothetical protein